MGKIAPYSVAKGISTNDEMIEAIALTLKSEGASESQFDFGKASEMKQAQMEHKANELVHTTNTSAGAELVPGAVQTTDFLDLAPRINPTLAQFKAFHGRNMDKVMEVPVIGELGLHKLEAESTDDTLTSVNASSGTLATGKVTVTQKKLAFRVTVTDEEAVHVNVVDILATIQRKLADSASRTTVSALINGDTVTSATTNINHIDGTPGGTEHFLVGDGLRKTAFTASSTADGGTLAFADFLTAQRAIGENANRDLAWLMGTFSHSLALGVDEFKQQYINGAGSTVISGKVPSFLGYDVIVDRYLGKANTAGKVDVGTPANNTKGQIILFDKYDLQWGHAKEYSIELVRIPAKGWQIVGYYYLGFSSACNKAGSDDSVALLYNLS